MLPTKFRFIWPSGFREDCLKSANQKQELHVVASPLKPLGQMNQNLVGSILGRSSINIANFIPIR
jgi:hypothetical protein